MAEVMNDYNENDLINFESFNDFDFNSLEQYLSVNNDNSCLEDRIDNNIAISCRSSPIVINNDLNSLNNQWLHPNHANHDHSYQLNVNPYEPINIGISGVNQSFIETHTRSDTTYTEPNNYYDFQNEISDQFCPNRYNGFQFNDNLFRQNNSQTIEGAQNESWTQQQMVNQKPKQDLSQRITQLSGQLLSPQEFEKQNEIQLFCGEQMDETSNQSSSKTDHTSQDRDEDLQTTNTVNKMCFDDNNNIVIEKNNMPSNHKTYSRAVKVIRMAPQPSKAPEMCSETMSAATGLVMLSSQLSTQLCDDSNYRPTVIRSNRVKKGMASQLTFAERQRLKRERNRIASKRCRQKKLETIRHLEMVREVLLEENQRYETHLNNYTQRLMELKLLLLRHRLNDCNFGDVLN